MCIIIDANVASLIFRKFPPGDYAPVIDWLYDGDGCLVYGGKLADELFKMRDVRSQIKVLNQAGRALSFEREAVDNEEIAVAATGLCISDDPHVIALARVSGARTLCSDEDNLHADFKNQRLLSNPRGHVYQNANHRHLLRHTKSCHR